MIAQDKNIFSIKLLWLSYHIMLLSMFYKHLTINIYNTIKECFVCNITPFSFISSPSPYERWKLLLSLCVCCEQLLVFQILFSFSETNSANGTKPDRNITRGTGTANPSGAPGFICFLVGSCCLIFSFLCNTLFVLCSFSFWPLYCLSIFYL